MVRIPHPHIPHLSLRQVKVLRLYFLLTVMTALVLYAVFRSHRFQELMRRKSEKVFSEAAGRPVTIGGFDLALVPPAFIVRDVAVANDPRGLPGNAFSAAEVEVRGIPRFLPGSVDLPKLRVLGPRVVLEVFPDGSTNFSTLFPKLAPSDGSGVDVRLGEAVIQKGTYRFREWRGKLDVILKDSALIARSGTFSRVTAATFLCRSVRLKLDDGEELDFALRTDAVLSPGRVHFSRLTIRSKALSVDATGGIEDVKKPVIALLARATFTGETLRRHFGVDLPLDGAVKVRASVRVPSGKPFQVRGVFEVPSARFGPFPMRGTGLIRVDRDGLLVDLPGLEYGGGTLEASVHLARLDHPPVPVQITVKGRNVDFERFFADIGLQGTGLMARADVDTTLTFGPGGIEHANGVGTLLLRPDPGRPSAVKGRHAIPVSGGGPLTVKDGKIVFDRTPLVTAGGVELMLDGTLSFGAWTPDFRIEIDAVDLKEVERLADNLYPAIQKSPLTPPLLLGGRGRMTGTFTRAFSDPLVTGSLSATGFFLKGADFGDAEASFTVDHDVLTLSPFRARSAGGTLVAAGKFAWGGRLGDHYQLDGLDLDLDRWPIERIMKFLSFDLPMEGPLTGKVPLSGITPAIQGAGDVVWESALAWGQPFDRVAGRLSFEGDRLRLSGVVGALGQGTAKGDGWYGWDGGYGFDLSAEGFPLEGVASFSSSFPGLTASVSGRLHGDGSVDRPGLEASLDLSRAAYRGRPVGKEAANEVQVSLRDGVLDGAVVVPGAGRFQIHGEKSSSKVAVDVKSLEVFAPALGLPAEAGAAGSLLFDADLEMDDGGALRNLRGSVKQGDLQLYGKRVAVSGGSVSWEEGKLTLSGLTLEDAARTGPSRNRLVLNGTVAPGGAAGGPPQLDLGVEGTFDASFLSAYLPQGNVSGPVSVTLRAEGAPDAPRLTGKAVLNGVDFAPAGGGTPVEGLTGTLVLTPGKVTTSGLTLRYDGNVEISGSVGLAGTALNGVRVNAHLEGLKSQPFPGFRTIVSGDLVLLGDTSLRTVRGDLTMLKGTYDQGVNLGLSTLLGKMSGSSAGLVPATTPLDAVGLEVRIGIPPSAIEIRNNIARLRADGNLVVRGTWGRPLLFGQVEAEDGGRLTLRGLKYDVLGAKLLFSNPAKIDPFFEVEARTDVKDYRVTVALSGTMSRMVPRFSSDPPLSEAQIISLLTTGDVPASVSSGAPVSSPISTEVSIAQATRELLAGLATDAAASRTKDFLKLDRLQIDPIFIGSTFDAPRLTVGKNLSPDLSVTYSYKASTNQEQVIQVEYQLSRDAFLQFVRDENGVYSVDLRIRQRLR